jgi:hypothetical protein
LQSQAVLSIKNASLAFGERTLWSNLNLEIKPQKLSFPGQVCPGNLSFVIVFQEILIEIFCFLLFFFIFKKPK